MSIGQGTESTNQRRNDHAATGTTVGFFTDPTTCIGCKACEVACKEWNQVPPQRVGFSGESYDNTLELGASSWRHVQFHELDAPPLAAAGCDGDDPLGWLFLSDVCKHCEVAGCLEVCPTGAIVRESIGAVVVQDDVCNGCGYCVVGCPFGVIDRREGPAPGAGGAYKCTFCHDRQRDGQPPACAKTCPTESIQFGPLEEMRARAGERAAELRERGVRGVSVYDPRETSVEGVHAPMLLLGAPERYGLPPAPVVPTVYQRASWTAAALTAAAALGAAALAFGVA